MKKIVLLLVLTFVSVQTYAQDLNSLSKKATESTSSSYLIDKLAGDQVKKFTKKLNLSEAQQEQVSSLVVSQLKSDKFSKLISGFSPDKLLGSGSKEEQSDKLTKALASDPEFQKDMGDILNEEQKATMESLKG